MQEKTNSHNISAEEIKSLVDDKNVDEVRKLIQASVIDSETRFDQGDNIMHLAVRSASNEMVSMVIAEIKGFSFNNINRRANTPLCLAIQLAKPNTQIFSPEERVILREKYEKIALSLIEADNNISVSANTKNVMRKSALDYLKKSVRNRIIEEALNKKIISELGKSVDISIDKSKLGTNPKTTTPIKEKVSFDIGR